MAFIVMAYIFMAYIFMAYIVMAGTNYDSCAKGAPPFRKLRMSDLAAVEPVCI